MTTLLSESLTMLKNTLIFFAGVITSTAAGIVGMNYMVKKDRAALHRAIDEAYK